MRPYFEKMDNFGKELKQNKKDRATDSHERLCAVEADIEKKKSEILNAGFSTAEINKRGWMTIAQRLEYLVEPGTWHPLHSLYNPLDNEEGTTNVVDGLGKIGGRWAVIIGFDNKGLAGGWLPGQADNVLRVTNLAP